ncbi:MAG: hypothetical protein V6Z86_07355 [Hyphomicrobiales bacterium]
MIKLDLKAQPFWLNLLDGVRFKVRPLTTSLMVAARKHPSLKGVEDGDEYTFLFTKALANASITDWEGVGDADGKPVKPTPDAIDAAFDLWPVFDAFQTSYVFSGLLLVEEKNDSTPSPNGPTATAKAGARPARKPAKTARPS